MKDANITPGTGPRIFRLPEDLDKVRGMPIYRPATGEIYPEQISLTEEQAQHITIDFTNTNLEMDMKDNEHLDPEEFTLARRHGLGASDMATILGLNIYETRKELMQNKLATKVTEEEKQIAEIPAVITGHDLEALNLAKHENYFGHRTWKAEDQYRLKEFPFIKINYDGIFGSPKQYYPTEAKVVTQRGEKNYNPAKAFFREDIGFAHTLPVPIKNPNLFIKRKASHYGIPVNYYCQLQLQMLGFNAPYGYVSVLYEDNWIQTCHLIWADQHDWNTMIIESYKFWMELLMLRGETYEQWLEAQRTRKHVPLSEDRRHSTDDDGGTEEIGI